MSSLYAHAQAFYQLMQQLPGYGALGVMLLGLLVGWWLYVPVHELLHVAGCLVAGGEVWELELAPLYGGHLLARWFDFIVPESDYAGRLTGFDTGGSDLVYLSTVLMPFAITVFPGFWLFVRTLPGNGVKPGHGRMFAVGALLVVVAAPLMSLTGDYYETGSILVSRLLAPLVSVDTLAWRHDDLFRLIGELAGQATLIDWLGVTASLLVGLVAAVLTMALGSIIARAMEKTR